MVVLVFLPPSWLEKNSPSNASTSSSPAPPPPPG
jgi:hypothetical protein